jgi:hypothetical protein
MKVENTNSNIKLFSKNNSNSLKVNLSNKNIVFQKIDLSNNDKFDKSEAKRNFWKGLKKPFKDVYNYAKANPIQFTIISGAGIGLTVLSMVNPLAGIVLTGLGCYFIAKPLIAGIKKVQNAKNGDDKEKAFMDFGESATYMFLTFGTNVMSKLIPVSEISKTIQGVNSGSKNIINFFSNATDISSFGFKSQEFLGMLGKGMRSSEISYSAGN